MILLVQPSNSSLILLIVLQHLKLIFLFNLQSFNKRNSIMYYFLPQYTSFQPTFIFFPTIVPTYITPNVQQVEYEITQLPQKTIFNQNDQFSAIDTRFVQQKASRILNKHRDSEKSQKTAQITQQVNFSNEDAENSSEEYKVQKSKAKKRKSSSKLFFDVEWKNQNRNIIPNIMNQMLSFVEKKHKSENLVSQLFRKYTHKQQWTIPKYYCYMKRMKASMGHYINENQLQAVNIIQEPEFEIYSREQQQFYLKICRICLDYFFKSESILISLTSKRMSHQKRRAHLVARRALLNRLRQIMNQKFY